MIMVGIKQYLEKRLEVKSMRVTQRPWPCVLLSFRGSVSTSVTCTEGRALQWRAWVGSPGPRLLPTGYFCFGCWRLGEKPLRNELLCNSQCTCRIEVQIKIKSVPYVYVDNTRSPAGMIGIETEFPVISEMALSMPLPFCTTYHGEEVSALRIKVSIIMKSVEDASWHSVPNTQPRLNFFCKNK